MSDGGIYGSMMTAFPEQWITIEYFDQQPTQDSGYNKKIGLGSIDGVIQCIERQIREQNGNLVTVRDRYLWTEEVLVSGKFIRDEEGIVYRIGADSEWIREGGYTRYTVYRVTGANGEDQNDNPVNVGTGSFA